MGCFNFRDYGECSFGDDCHVLHEGQEEENKAKQGKGGKGQGRKVCVDQ